MPHLDIPTWNRLQRFMYTAMTLTDPYLKTGLSTGLFGFQNPTLWTSAVQFICALRFG